jgi:hypothetical protein
MRMNFEYSHPNVVPVLISTGTGRGKFGFYAKGIVRSEEELLHDILNKNSGQEYPLGKQCRLKITIEIEELSQSTEG